MTQINLHDDFDSQTVGLTVNDAPAREPEEWDDLLPLTPGYIAAEHGGYVSAINKALGNIEVRNIALSGNYGVGKSSILKRVTEENKSKVVELSLSTLAPIDASKAYDSAASQATTPTNQIQQEIVKQLLYREEPDRTPGSRFRRIERFSWRRQLALAVLIGLGATLVFLIAGWASTIVRVLTPLIDLGLWVYPILFVFITGGALMAGFLLHGRLRIKQFSAGPAAVTLDENSVSYFDQYLDEIVYFFETSKRDIVIFEDIDRFNNSHIFETLRSLNTLLNASPQIDDPVRFVYAIKDSIFDRIGLELEGRKSDLLVSEITDPAQAEAVRANRTKFFDLVIPVVPFITHRSARNLTAQILSGITHTVSDDLVDLAGRFVPDMRLLKNVRNEFVVFRARIFSGSGSELQLSQTDLFAMMLYKSTHLTDFEVIRLGKSKLDQLYELSRELVVYNIRRIEREKRATQRELTRTTGMTARSRRLGDRLIAHIDRTVRAASMEATYGQYVFGGSAKSAVELRSPAFWRELAEAETGGSVGWRNQRYGQALNFTRADVAELVGDALDENAWLDVDRKALNVTLDDQQEQLTFLRSADMGDLIKRPEFLVEFEKVDQSLEAVAEALLTRGLALQLIRAGYINRNFTLFTSTFHGDRVSPTATNFIIHHVERNLMDEHFALSDDDVDAVVRERGRQSLSEPALFNIAVLDRLLCTDTSAADVMVGALVRLDDDAVRFINAYLSGGSERRLFIERFARRSPQMLRFLISQAEVDDETRIEFVSHAFASLVDGVDYKIDDEVATYARDHYEDFEVLKDDAVSPAAASRIAANFARPEIRVATLSTLGDTVRAAFIGRDLYVLDRDNLISAVGAETGLALDSIRASNKTVYNNVLANLGAYVAAVKGFSATNDTEEGFIETIKDVLEAEPDRLVEIIELSSVASRVDDLSDVPKEAWPLLAQFNRFPPTFENVASYIEEVGSLDSNLAEVLSYAGLIRVGEAQPQTERKTLALTILESRTVLSSELRAKLVASLGLTTYIDATEITPEHGALFAQLLDHEIIDDDADTFAHLTTTNWQTRERVINASALAASLVTPSFVGSDLAQLITSESVDDAVKSAIIDRAEEFVVSADRAALTQLARYALQENRTVTTDVVELMASSGVPGQVVLPLLHPNIHAMSDDQLFQILRSMGGTFAQLAVVGRDKPKFANTPAMLELLSSLKQRGIVNSFDPTDDPIQVNKKHK